ncbi:MAG: hypothetical protein PW788_04675 [Micavibrio sp.]|nr:hypothetical protein [Micavibrio sp.]
MMFAALKYAAPATPAPTNAALNALLENAGVSKTVYSYVMPETEAALDALVDGDRAALHHMYREAWTQKQDVMHEAFFATWKAWSSPVLKFDAGDFPFFYTTGGASEALRETIYAYGHRARAEGFSPVIHVFEGDYEGFAAYATAAGIKTVAHNRHDWRAAVLRVGATDQFYISQPSAIDGNVWGEYPAFAAALYRQQPSADLMLDLTYVGCVARDFTIEAYSPNVQAIFFSLSKPMGVYYHRIGGLLSRQAYPGLFGNKWFKNLLSLKLGTKLMQTYGVHELPQRYAALGQGPALRQARETLGLDLTPADVWMLATATPVNAEDPLHRYLTRGGRGDEKLRLCLTPSIAHIINPAVDGTVRARAHEVLPERNAP